MLMVMLMVMVIVMVMVMVMAIGDDDGDGDGNGDIDDDNKASSFGPGHFVDGGTRQTSSILTLPTGREGRLRPPSLSC